MTIQLPEHLERYVHDQVLAGRFRTEDDVILDALERHRQREFRCQSDLFAREFRCQSTFSRGGRPRRRGSRTMPRRWEMTSTQSSAP